MAVQKTSHAKNDFCWASGCFIYLIKLRDNGLLIFYLVKRRLFAKQLCLLKKITATLENSLKGIERYNPNNIDKLQPYVNGHVFGQFTPFGFSPLHNSIKPIFDNPTSLNVKQTMPKNTRCGVYMACTQHHLSRDFQKDSLCELNTVTWL